jgi:hypothetical protein
MPQTAAGPASPQIAPLNGMTLMASPPPMQTMHHVVQHQQMHMMPVQQIQMVPRQRVVQEMVPMQRVVQEMVPVQRVQQQVGT